MSVHSPSARLKTHVTRVRTAKDKVAAAQRAMARAAAKLAAAVAAAGSGQ
jgi:hypothetical protein